MSAEVKTGWGVPSIIQEAIEEQGNEEERLRRAICLREEATEVLGKHGTSKVLYRLREKITHILETEIWDELDRRVKVTISARKRFDLKQYEPDLTRAAIRIEVGDYDSLTLPPPELGFGDKFPLPQGERLDKYSELLEVVKEKTDFEASVSCL